MINPGGTGRGVLVVLAALALWAGCVPASVRQARKLEGKYETGNPGKGWVAVPAGGADRAWYHEGMGATIYTDSNCGPRYAEARVEDLTTELISGFRNVEPVQERQQPVAGREGLVRIQQGRLDGIEIQLGTLVFNMNACNFDIVLISPPAEFSAGQEAWQRVIDGFQPR